MRTFNNEAVQIQLINQNSSQPNIAISSTGSAICTSPPETNSGINLYIEDVTGGKWYFRVNLISHMISVESQSALNNVSGYSYLLLKVIIDNVTLL